MRKSLLALAAGLGVLAAGCASTVRDDWDDAPSHPPLPARHIEVGAGELPRACGHYPGLTLFGCAIRLHADGLCIIYTAPQPAAWLMDHERRHCAGWDHGPANVSSGRVAALSGG